MAIEYKNIHQKLIDKCKQGNNKAQFELYKLYYKALYNTSLRLVNNSMEAEDIMQEAFLSAFNKIETYKNEVSFGAWLKKIVINRSLDSLKKRKLLTDSLYEERIEILEEEHSENETEIAQKLAQVKQTIAQMNGSNKLIITLYLIEGYNYDEIAEILDMSNSAVRTAYSRARKKLQDILNKKEMVHE